MIIIIWTLQLVQDTHNQKQKMYCMGFLFWQINVTIIAQTLLTGSFYKKYIVQLAHASKTAACLLILYLILYNVKLKTTKQLCYKYEALKNIYHDKDPCIF